MSTCHNEQSTQKANESHIKQKLYYKGKMIKRKWKKIDDKQTCLDIEPWR